MKLPKKQSVTSRVLIALTLTVAGIAGFSGMAEAATCSSCHAQPGQTTDIRPVDSAFRNITTGGIKGSHVKHIPLATVDANACTPCHAGAASYVTKHRDGFVNVTSATMPGLSYSKGAKFAQSGAANLTLGTCSTASCHANVYGTGTVATPVWGDAAANCTACHTTPIGATGPATGSHANVTAHAVACTTCHNSGTSSTSMPSVGHNNGTIDIANVGYPLAKVKGSAAATCSTASCHLNVYGAGSVTTPVWGTSASCTACHTVAIDATGPATGSHVAHNDTTCTDCHAAGTTQITKPSTGHADGNVTVTNGYPVTAKHAAGSYSGTCSTASCHADPYSAGQVATPVWGTSAGCAACHTGANVITATGPATGSHAKHAVACTSCHNAGTSATTKPDTAHATGFIDVVGVGYPANKIKGSPATTCSAASCHADPYSAGTVVTPVWGTASGCVACHTGAGAITANGPATGSHTNVASHAVACTSCHADGTSATTSPSTGHADGNIDVANVGYPADKIKGSAKVSCSTASCHADPYSAGSVVTPVWGTTGNNCAACHTGANVITINGPATGNHTNVASHAVACTTCHEAGTSSTTAPSAGHRDGNIDVANVGYPVDKIKGSAKVSCSTASCHADPYSAGTVVTPVWGTTGNGCAACHTTPITANGPATGSHTNVASHAVACTTCHAAGTTASTAPTFANGHNDGNIDVVNVGYPLDKAKGSAKASCSTTACHGSTSPVWGANTTNDTCTKCHGTGTATVNAANEYVVAPSDASATDTGKVSSLAKVGAHQTHLQLFNGLSQQGADAKARCEVCHALPATGNHANGSSTPVFSGIAAGGSYNAGTCSVSCHNPAGTTLAVGNAGTATTPSWTDANYIADGTLKTDANCNTCHKSPGNPAFTASLSHDATAMPLGIATDCSVCHGHNGGTGGIAGQQHMDGTRWGNGSCDACHGYPPLTATQFSARGANYVNAKVEDYAGGAGHHATHLLATVKASEGFTPCLPCHPSAFHNGGNGTVSKLFVNVNDAADLTFRFDSDRSKRYTVATQSCSNVSCHYQPTPAWTFGL
ncbi:MAG: CxxxxCH/CxxCH domain-containing protein [Desulfuromonadaceae bacterium]|nr:CxxxxCH/CxxCH domain-containing protein [Desulfuromonadaceae bacterium]